LTEDAKKGKEIEPFRDLVQLLLKSTVLHPNDPGVRLIYGASRRVGMLGGFGDFNQPLRLRNDYFLRLNVSLGIDQTDHGPRLKTRKSSIQYQAKAEPGTDDWLFRYDYIRDATEARPHPQAHVQVRALAVVPEMIPANRTLERIHFPTRRIPIEGVIRLLAEERQFGIPTATKPPVWRAMLSAAESAFLKIAHEAELGPAG
jgi:hypothetical protein